jgi:hypothetical protein
MFGLFKKQARAERDAQRGAFERVTKSFRKSEAAIQNRLGTAINMANTMFERKHSSIREFKALPVDTKNAYIKSLEHFEEVMGKTDAITGYGFGLLKLWLIVEAENDTELADQFSKELAFFRRQDPNYPGHNPFR